jgi:4-hydroxy-tetrahydrodipicolinate reductase
MNPGLTQILGVVNSANLADTENVTVIESVDVSCHHSAETWKNCGYGLPIEDPRIPGMLEKEPASSALASTSWPTVLA